MNKIEVVKQNLYLVELTDVRNKIEVEIASESKLEYLKKYWRTGFKIVRELSNQCPDVEVTLTGADSGRCYLYREYKVVSKSPLEPIDFDILRALGTFMVGQRTGDVVSHVEKDNLHIYTLVSECDSSD